MNGLVLLDKPKGITSHDAVNRWRKLAGTKRAGHLGTLDPMATGLLMLVSGNTTRLARFFEKQEKTYEAEVRFGFVSDTYDADGEVSPTGIASPDPVQIAEALDRFRGPLLQKPPPVSAKKIGGIPAYKLARSNKPVDLPPVPVSVHRLEWQMTAPGTCRLHVTCSAGTYIRSLAHDLGQALGCGAILTGLRRTASGTFQVSDARTFEALDQLKQENKLSTALIPPARMLPEFPIAYVDAATEAQIRVGREFRTSPFAVPSGAPFVKALSYAGDLVAIGELKFPNVYHPMMVL
ncbi:MAG TPA: tRNA pseudouridine(55) synthase TruB [Bryobacteraceae bacterium]|nr:tRNA pseudouridine(55) synthase TruB [Bryobacteraceae bacterium]